MCIVAAKYFPEVGWVGVKNRDRNYKPIIKIKQSFRNGIERLFMWDEKTKYAEGINEFGIAILSAATAVKNDEKEGGKSSAPTKKAEFYSPDGKRIREALFEKTIEKVVAKLIEVEIPGNTLIFTKDKCILLEGTFLVDKETGEEKEYIYKTKVIKKDETVVRTNHGVLLPDAGYQLDSEEEKHRTARISSDARKKKVEQDIQKVVNHVDMLDCVSSLKNSDPQLNPIRKSKKHGKDIMVTTGQIMICPSEKTLHYRPIWSEVEFNFDKFNGIKNQTFFEIVSTRKLITFKEWVEKKLI